MTRKQTAAVLAGVTVLVWGAVGLRVYVAFDDDEPAGRPSRVASTETATSDAVPRFVAGARDPFRPPAGLPAAPSASSRAAPPATRPPAPPAADPYDDAYGGYAPLLEDVYRPDPAYDTPPALDENESLAEGPVRLLGTIGETAILQDASGQMYLGRPGGTLGRAYVVSVSENEVVLERDGVRDVLRAY